MFAGLATKVQKVSLDHREGSQFTGAAEITQNAQPLTMKLTIELVGDNLSW